MNSERLQSGYYDVRDPQFELKTSMESSVSSNFLGIAVFLGQS
jgi:hypothetical protein